MNTEMMPYRLKSVRRKRRLLIKDRDKQLLKLDRERRHISLDPDYKRTVPLDEPYQKGWKRLFVLKPEVAKSDKAEFYESILYCINEVQYHYNRSFKNSKRIKRWHRYYHKNLPKLQLIKFPQGQKGEHKLTEEQRDCFQLFTYWDEGNYRWNHYYEFTRPEVYKIAVLPNMITTVKVGDALLEQRKAWIDDQFYKNGLQHRLNNLQRSYNGWKNRSEKLKYSNPLKNKPKWDWEDEY